MYQATGKGVFGAHANSKCQDQPARSHSLITALAIGLLSYLDYSVFNLNIGTP